MVWCSAKLKFTASVTDLSCNSNREGVGNGLQVRTKDLENFREAVKEDALGRRNW